jgi:hypothetical protein
VGRAPFPRRSHLSLQRRIFYQRCVEAKSLPCGDVPLAVLSVASGWNTFQLVVCVQTCIDRHVILSGPALTHGQHGRPSGAQGMKGPRIVCFFLLVWAEEKRNCFAYDKARSIHVRLYYPRDNEGALLPSKGLARASYKRRTQSIVRIAALEKKRSVDREAPGRSPSISPSRRDCTALLVAWSGRLVILYMICAKKCMCHTMVLFE